MKLFKLIFFFNFEPKLEYYKSKELYYLIDYMEHSRFLNSNEKFINE